ncbi:Flagellin [Clostridium liquoris]|jgi:flagellin|uniref:Flagellin n=1 Tax=Clostridium liquoris TaxID=1289519 RepID=A0A2T0B6C6_9CLOT|nr:flagellin [Clostridium liquoris]PRR79425.1 Flagellin [Clostridium liquoris]
MRLNNNISSLNIFREYNKNLKLNSKSLSRISSGEKIIKASDGPNEMSQSERMRIQIRGLQMAQRNVQDGVSMMQTADGALSSLNSILGRVRELVVQSGSGANSPEDQKVIKGEINQMIDGYEEIAKNTEFNGVKLFDLKNDNGEAVVKKSMQIGANSGDSMDIKLYDLSPDKVGATMIDSNDEKKIDSKKTLQYLKDNLDIKDADFVDKALEIVDAASNTIVDVRSKYGAISNKFESTLGNLGDFEIATQRSESRIRDVDIAEEMIEFTKTGILIESGNAMMVQSNKFPQDALRILENVKSR